MEEPHAPDQALKVLLVTYSLVLVVKQTIITIGV
jgi:hypothetical protein